MSKTPHDWNSPVKWPVFARVLVGRLWQSLFSLATHTYTYDHCILGQLAFRKYQDLCKKSNLVIWEGYSHCKKLKTFVWIRVLCFWYFQKEKFVNDLSWRLYMFSRKNASDHDFSDVRVIFYSFSDIRFVTRKPNPFSRENLTGNSVLYTVIPWLSLLSVSGHYQYQGKRGRY
jgi:hypothetical protein